MDTQLLIEKPAKLKYSTIDIKVKSCIFNENNRPIKLTTSKDIEYVFPKLIEMNSMRLTQLRNYLCSNKEIMITRDNDNRIHKLENISLNWNESNKYKLMVISLKKGLLFDGVIEITAYENVSKFYKNYGYIKYFNDGSEITIIIKDTLPVNIPIIY